MSQVQTNLKALCQLAKELGATNAKSFSAKGVVVDERVRLKCCVPVCDDYGINLMCPPNTMSLNEFRETLAKYQYAVLVQIEAPFSEEMKKEIHKGDDVAALYKSDPFLQTYKEAFDPVKAKLHRIVRKVEAQAFAQGYRFATGFVAGSCKLCPECVTQKSNQPCRHPFQARPSMEAMGIDTLQTAKNAALPFKIPAKDKAVWNGLILIT